MRITKQGRSLYKFNELMEPAKNIALEEIQYILFFDAASSIKSEQYLDPKIKLLKEKGFKKIEFYRFVIDEEFVKIDFTFDYPINEETFVQFKEFAKFSNHHIPIYISSAIKSGDLIIEVKSKKYTSETRSSNIHILYDTEQADTQFHFYINQLRILFESYYKFILNRLYRKILEYIEENTNHNLLKKYINSYEFQFNGEPYEEEY